VQAYSMGGAAAPAGMDAKTKKLVWQGQAADVLSLPVNDPAKATQRIDQAVGKILAKYPSQAAA